MERLRVVAYIHSSRVELAIEIMCKGFPDSCSRAGQFHPTQSDCVQGEGKVTEH